MCRGLIFLIIFLSFFLGSLGQILISPARTDEIPDLSIVDNQYGTSLNYPYDSSSSNDCVTVNNIEYTSDGKYYKIQLDLNLNGKGCKTSVPWITAPSTPGMKIYGKDALKTCFTNDGNNNCRFITSGGSNSLSVSFDPPSYSFPLSTPQNAQTVPFGNAGYFSYELESKGACANYGYKNINSQTITKIKSATHTTIALSIPNRDECDRLPTQSSFMSSLSASQVAQNIHSLTNNILVTNTSIQSYLSQLAVQAGSNMISGSNPGEMAPFGYINASTILRIIDPFLCKINSSAHYIGAKREEVHACPMSISEWQSILPDVVILNETVDILYGPNTTSYGSFQRDGPWIPPGQYSNALPVQFHRCNTRDKKDVNFASESNYASKHMPFNLNFGPTCTSLQTDNSHITAKVNVGGFIGISSNTDPFSGSWTVSVGFPVRTMNQIGNTVKVSNISAPGVTINPNIMIGQFSTSSGTNGNALNIDTNALRYILCNGLAGAPTAAGFSYAFGYSLGPLVSTLRNASAQAPIWPNPFRYTSNSTSNPNCAGCTFPTINSQKGWTIMDSQVWSAGQGIECGKYQSDHSLWARILALINTDIGNFNNNTFFSLWNQTSGRVDFFLNNSQKLNLNLVSQYLPQIFGSFIPGIGKDSWVQWIGDLGKFSCRPPSNPYLFNVNDGQQSIPICSLLQRQLYYQTYMLNDTLKTLLKKSITTPDLNSAARTGIYNPLAPNIWFGIFQKSIFDGNSEWLMFLEDTFDITGNSIFETDGIAQNVTGTIEMLIPVSTVRGPPVANVLKPNYIYSVSETFCQVFDVFSKPNLSPISFIGSKITFSSPYNNVPWLFVRFSTIFQGEANYVTFNYQVSSITVYVNTGTNPVMNQITNFFTTIIGNDILLQLPYDTVITQNTYTINIPIIIGSLASNILPIIQVSSYFETNIFSSNVFYVNLSNSDTLEYIGCSEMGIESTSPIQTNRYSCNGADCFASFEYALSPASPLTLNCSNPNTCRSYSNQFQMNTCGFSINQNNQLMTHNIHLFFDGSSVNYNLLSEILSIRFSNVYNILNCGLKTSFSNSFVVKFCGYIGNTITGQKRSIPCNNYVLQFYNDVLNNRQRAYIYFSGEYAIIFDVYINNQNMNFDISFDTVWFVHQQNENICQNTSSYDVFCNYNPNYIIIELNMNLQMPFACGSFLQNQVIFDDIRISSQLNAFSTMINNVNIYQSQIGNFDPVTLICGSNNAFDTNFAYNPFTTTTTTSTHAWTNFVTLPTFDDLIALEDAFDEKIQGIVPPCAIDFSKIQINPDFIPLNSICTPYIEAGTYEIFDNCSLSVSGQPIPLHRLSGVPYYQNIYYVDANFSDFFIYQCLISPTFPNSYNVSICTVNGSSGERNGTNCYLYEDLLQNCLEWWNLSCAINTFPQALFFFMILMIFVFILIALAAVFTSIEDAKEEGQFINDFDLYIKDWMSKNT